MGGWLDYCAHVVYLHARLFWEPIYNIFDLGRNEYIEAVIRSRISMKNDADSHDPIKTACSGLLDANCKEIMSMLVESGWTQWRRILRK